MSSIIKKWHIILLSSRIISIPKIEQKKVQRLSDIHLNAVELSRRWLVVDYCFCFWFNDAPQYPDSLNEGITLIDNSNFESTRSLKSTKQTAHAIIAFLSSDCWEKNKISAHEANLKSSEITHHVVRVGLNHYHPTMMN